MDMRFNWLWCREAQKQFCFFWRPRGLNLADYWMKHHPVAHHQNICAEFLTKKEDIQEQSREREQAHHMNTASEGAPKTNPQEASCKGVLNNAQTMYRRRTVLQLKSLMALFETRIQNARSSNS
jgi:hypothetical protein